MRSQLGRSMPFPGDDYESRVVSAHLTVNQMMAKEISSASHCQP